MVSYRIRRRLDTLSRRFSARPHLPQMALKFAGLDDAQKLEFLKNELKEILGLIKELTPQEEPAKPKEMKAKG